MKTRFKFINFDEVIKNEWTCFTNKGNDILGAVTFYIDGVFSADCLRDIAEFMEGLNKQG